MKVIGVDASSTRLAAVVLADDWMKHERLALPHDIEDACQRAHGWASALITDETGDIDDVDLVLVEAPFFHRQNPNGAVGLAQVNGALLAGFADVQVLGCAPSKWKKGVLGHGNATKDMIAAWVQEKHPTVAATFWHRSGKTERSAMVFDQDLADAYCIAQHARSIVNLRAKASHVRVVKRTKPCRKRKTSK